MKYIMFILMISMSLTQCVGRVFAAQPKATASPAVRSKSVVTSKTMVNSETRVKSGQVSRQLMDKLKVQAMKAARAELAAELEAEERARLEALEELSATVDVETEVSDETVE
jgi:hypothetical protein